jgi:hypothetical protein
LWPISDKQPAIFTNKALLPTPPFPPLAATIILPAIRFSKKVKNVFFKHKKHIINNTS